MTHRVTVSRDALTFSAAHFLLIPGHKCERLHGHNYAVTVIIQGTVDAGTGFVVDFAVVKDALQPAIDGLDHRVLVPGRNPTLQLTEQNGSSAVRIGGVIRFVFPTSHVAVVPVPETTAEHLAEYLAHTLRGGLVGLGVAAPASIAVEVEESPGQSATFFLGSARRGAPATGDGVD